MKVNIVAIGKLKSKTPEKAIIDEYTKRCHWKIAIKELNEPRNLEVEEKKIEEGKLLLSSISASSKIIVLDERGVNITSPDLAKKIENWQVQGASEISFLIGGANGHSQMIRDKADLILSFGKLTLPHMLMRAVLSEQIYRLESIISSHPYHKI